MSRIRTIARRSFLVGSLAIAGGVAFGIYAVRRPAPNPLRAGDGEAALNPFVFIDQAGVTLIAPRAEMGQGVHTTWAALIAEELDVDLDKVRVLHGPAAKAYYNSAFIGDSLPNKGYDITDRQHAVGEALGVLAKVINLQGTGGSTSMKDGFERMRSAGATARETLKEAAARRLGVARSSLRTASGQVIAPDGSAFSYPELAGDAATLEPVSDVALRDPRDWRYLGQSQPRVDMVAKVTGTAEFGADIRLPGMKFAALRMNPNLGGAMNSFDASAATEMPGVDRIIDLGGGIAVVGRNTWLAQQAADAVEIDWAPASYPEDTDALFTRIAEAFDKAPNSALRDEGDVSAVPDGATVIEAEYKMPYLAHATMEPMNATALIDDGRLDVWCGNQSPTLVQRHCAKIADLGTADVHIHTPFMGGGFGRRGELDFAEYATRIAMEMPGTPVKLSYSREEDMTHDFYRPGTMARFKGAVHNGKAVMIDGEMASQSTLAQIMQRAAGLPMMGPDKVLVEGLFNQPYAVPNYLIRGYLVDLDVPVGFWRAVGNSHNGFYHETFMDEMAHAAGQDPLAFRLELMRNEHAPSAGTLEAVAKMSGWTGQTPDGVGRGVAFTYSFGTPVAQVVEVVEEDGLIRMTKGWIACDMGLALDPLIVEAQMVGGMIFGLSAATQEITFSDGRVEQENFPDFDCLRMHNTPEIEVTVLETNRHMGGAGEPGTPPALAALGNALFDLTGRRARSLPFSDQFDLLT